MRAAWFFLLLPALTGLWAGCATGSNELPPPKATIDLVLKRNEREVTATLRIGEALRVFLPPPLEPGDEWEIVGNPGQALRQITGLRPVPEAPGTLMVTFQATRSRRTRLLFMAIKPGEWDATAAEQFAIGVDISDGSPASGS